MHPDYHILDFEHTVGDRKFWSSSLLMQSSLDSDSITESNIRTFLYMFSEEVIYCRYANTLYNSEDLAQEIKNTEILVIQGGFNSIEIFLSEKIIGENEKLIEILHGLCDYPVISEDTLSEVEWEWFENFVSRLNPYKLIDHALFELENKLENDLNLELLVEFKELEQFFNASWGNLDSSEISSEIFQLGLAKDWEIEATRGESVFRNYDEKEISKCLMDYLIKNFEANTNKNLDKLKNYLQETDHDKR